MRGEMILQETQHSGKITVVYFKHKEAPFYLKRWIKKMTDAEKWKWHKTHEAKYI